ncbi:PQQ-binding-like beta-propeller repeat protein [Kitasatospora sp. NPDC058965]|uniref:protein kinase domain-containing protein n=1 Tax=Kitasatospora sp. NPDC058965 TaxID=3346682 RepID=UPI00367CB4C3
MPIQPLDPSDPVEVGPYRLIARLGAGGMGLVYLARSAGGRTVAVKVVRPELAEDREFRARFAREVAAARAVGGAFTAPVTDSDTEAPLPWLATGYVLGSSLSEAVAQHGPLPVSSVRTLGAGLAQALLTVHAAGLVHRDLKPSNVLLSSAGPRVIDFGIARALDEERLTSTGLVVGSAGFMSPEQAAGRAADPASDVFSLGSVLVFAATGAGPFGRDGDASAAAQLYRVIHEEPELSGLPEELWPVVTACLAKDPQDRLTPTELVELLGPGVFAGWLPAALSAQIADHAAAVLDLEPPTGPHPVAAAPAPARPVPPTGPETAPTVALPGPADPATVPVPTPAPVPRSTSRRALLAGGGALLLAAAGGAAWALRGGSPAPKPHPAPGPTGSPAPGPTRTRAKGEAPAPNWTWTIPTVFIMARPACAHGLVLIGGDGLFALDGKDGTVRWTDAKASADDVHPQGNALFYSQLNLMAADPGSGSVLWSFAQKPGPDPNTLVTASKVLAADDRAVYALCDVMGADVTAADTPHTKGIMALSHQDGSLLWLQHRKPDADPDVDAVVAGDTLLYTDSSTNLVARSVSTGEQVWFANTESQAPYQPATDGGRVFCSAPGLGLQAVAVSGGKQVWLKTPPQKRLWYTPAAVGDGVVYTVLGGMTVTRDNTTYTPPAGPVLIAYQADNGNELWRVALPEEVTMSEPPFLAGSTLVVGTDAKGVFAVDTKDRRVSWNFRTTGAAGSTWEFATDGKQLIAVQDSKVYALPLD